MSKLKIFEASRARVADDDVEEICEGETEDERAGRPLSRSRSTKRGCFRKVGDCLGLGGSGGGGGVDGRSIVKSVIENAFRYEAFRGTGVTRPRDDREFRDSM